MGGIFARTPATIGTALMVPTLNRDPMLLVSSGLATTIGVTSEQVVVGRSVAVGFEGCSSR